MSKKHHKLPSDGLSREVYKLGETIELKLNIPVPEVANLPFFPYLPKDQAGLLAARIALRERAAEDLSFREDFREMCRRDPVFFAQTCGYIYDPRMAMWGDPRRPVVLWPDQIDMMAILHRWWGIRSVGCGKSRGLGFSYVMAFMFAHAILLKPGSSIGVISESLIKVDSKDTNSIMGKMRFILDRVPEWMKLDRRGNKAVVWNVAEKMMRNESIDSSVQGFAATDKNVRGMRFTVLLNDEWDEWPGDVAAAIRTTTHTTNMRIYLSTFQGVTGPHYQIMHLEKSSLLKVFAWWWANPARWAGAYTSEKGVLRIVDAAYKYPPDYPFVLDGLLRSPYVDAFFRESGATRQHVLEELYGVQPETRKGVFRQSSLESANAGVRPPAYVGTVGSGVVRRSGSPILKRESIGDEEIDGLAFVWDESLGSDNDGRYYAGCDLAAGVGAAYSTLQVIDVRDGQQVLEYASNTDPIVEFARKVFILLSWISQGKHSRCALTFENNGMGRSFGLEIVRLGYGNVERREYAFSPDRKMDKRRHFQQGKQAEYYGRKTGNDGGMTTMIEMGRAVSDGELLIRSDRLAFEMEHFGIKHSSTGEPKPEYPRSLDGNGDLVMAMALAWSYAKERRAVASVGIAGSTIDSYNYQDEQEALRRFIQERSSGSTWSSRFLTSQSRKSI